MSKDTKKYEKLLKIWKSYSLSERIRYRLIYTFGDRRRLNKKVIRLLEIKLSMRKARFNNFKASVKSFFNRFIAKIFKRLNTSEIAEDIADRRTNVVEKATSIGKKVISAGVSVCKENSAIDKQVSVISKYIKNSKSSEDLDKTIDIIQDSADRLISDGVTSSKENIVNEIKLSVKDSYDEKRKEINKKNNKAERERMEKSPMALLTYNSPARLMERATREQEIKANDPMNDIKEPVTEVNIGDNPDGTLLNIKHDSDTLISIKKRNENDTISDWTKYVLNTMSEISHKEHYGKSPINKHGEWSKNSYWIDGAGLLRKNKQVVIQSRKLDAFGRKLDAQMRIVTG